ncbi:MAG: hypothetical protein RIC51_01475 [Erythrobacter sp.]|uniref:Nmad3 family putative nucleotide modification protein n=1 Tax=Erythrobacter sp. TaxID=1042 RepID=UPI0032EED011
MKIVFSRKGFDTSAGGGPSPIADGKPLSLPIPAARKDGGAASATTYGDLGLGEYAARASRGRVGAQDPCHHDPMFLDDGTCLFGQCGAAQTHLERQGVGVGDVFVFFGLFASQQGEPHHRIFGYLRVEEAIPLAGGAPRELVEIGHPHALALHGRNDCIWRGPGRVAGRASDGLRLTVPGGPATLWQRPSWLKRGGLSYHDRADRWIRGGKLRAVSRGQEFVADAGRRKAPREWLESVIAEITAS